MKKMHTFNVQTLLKREIFFLFCQNLTSFCPFLVLQSLQCVVMWFSTKIIKTLKYVVTEEEYQIIPVTGVIL